MLDGDACHGYGLQTRLEACGLCPDPAALYRALHRLETDGSVASDWVQPVAGPRRRLYRLTPDGRRKLEELADMIIVARDHHDLFLRARAAWRPLHGP